MRSKQIDRWFRLVKYLPKKLIYFCAMRMWVETTVGKYENTDPTKLTFLEAVKRFEYDNKI